MGCRPVGRERQVASRTARSCFVLSRHLQRVTYLLAYGWCGNADALRQTKGKLILFRDSFIRRRVEVSLCPILPRIDALMAPSGLPPAIVAAVLWALIFVSVRTAFVGRSNAVAATSLMERFCWRL